MSQVHNIDRQKSLPEAVTKSQTLKINNSAENVQKYSDAGFENTYYLGYRDLPLLFENYTLGKKAIDYGCGMGRSSRFLKSYGFEVLGVDVSKEMLINASKANDLIHYVKIKSGKIPVSSDSYDLFFSCFVLFSISTKSELLSIFKEAHRCLKKQGTFIIVTGSEHLYSHNWLSYNVAYPENKFLYSGAKTKIRLKDLGINFINYYWTDADYSELFQLAGFRLIEKHFPFGRIQDGKEWISETQYPPYVVYVLQKTTQ